VIGGRTDKHAPLSRSLLAAVGSEEGSQPSGSMEGGDTFLSNWFSRKKMWAEDGREETNRREDTIYL